VDPSRILDVIVGVAGVAVPIYIWDATRREKERKENLSRFQFLITEAQERPGHKHPEHTGALQAENIQYGPRKINGK